MSEIRHIRFSYSTAENRTPGNVMEMVQRAIERVKGHETSYDLDWSTFEIETNTQWIDERTFGSDEIDSTPYTVMEFTIEGVER